MVKASDFEVTKLEGAPGMKKIAFAALFMGATGLLACGGDDDGDIMFADSGPGIDAAPATCNPVTQRGCAEGDKCSWLVVQEDPNFLGRTACVPDGTVELGGACTEGAPGEDSGYDDCVAGTLCLNAICRDICSIEPDSCETGFACSSYTNTFSDDAAENTGVCDPTCDPVAQDCEDETQGCYLQLFNGKATCARVAPGAEEFTQGVQCSNNGMQCYLNGCAIGYGGFLYAGMGVPRDCTKFCAPEEVYLIDPDGDGEGEVSGGDPQGTPDISDCTPAQGGALQHQCRFFQSYFVDQNSMYLEYISDTYGFCTPQNGDFGNCTQFSEEWFLATYDAFIGGGGTPEGWGDHITAECDGNLGCANGCAKVATLDALDTAYCEDPDNADGPACASGAKGVKIVRRSQEKMWQVISTPVW
jgi:hypothetical protein